MKIVKLKTKEEILKTKQKFSSNTGVYFLIKNDEIVYVGKSDFDIFSRISFHASTKKDWDEFSYIIIPKEKNIIQYESEYIGYFKPKYNGQKYLFGRTYSIDNQRTVELNGYIIE